MTTRREFLATFSVGAALASVGGCATAGAPGPASPIALDEFMRLSELLTGVADLDRETGRVYLAGLSPETARELASLSERAGLRSPAKPRSLDDLGASGAIDSEPVRTAAVTELLIRWYSGTYETAGGPQVATWVGALGWSTLGFTKAPGVCGGAGYWADAP